MAVGKKGHIRVNCPFAGKSGAVGAILDAAEPRQASIVGAVTQVEPAVPPYWVLMTANIPNETLLQIMLLDAHSDGCMIDFVIDSGALTHVLPFGLADLQSSQVEKTTAVLRDVQGGDIKTGGRLPLALTFVKHELICGARGG